MSAALADVSTTETGPVRAFLRALTAEAAPVGDWPGCGVLLIGHSTKAAGDAPDAGVVAGSAAWHDGARGVLTMTELAGDERLIECAKATCATAPAVRWWMHLTGGAKRGTWHDFETDVSGEFTGACRPDAAPARLRLR